MRLQPHLATGVLVWALATGPLEAVVNPPVPKWVANSNTEVGGCFNTNDPPGYFCDTGWYASPAAADLNGDGQREVIWGGYDLFVIDGATGANLAMAGNAHRIWPGIAVADLSGNGDLEIVVGRGSNQLHVYHAVAGSPWTINTVFARNPFANNCGGGNACEVRTLAVEDFETDGLLDIIVGRASGGATEQLNAYDAFGNQRPGWPARRTGELGFGWGMYNENVTLGDLDGDGLKEIFGPTDTHYVTALDPFGNQLGVNPLYLPDQVWAEAGVHVLQSMDLQGYANCSGGFPLAERLRPNFANSAPAIGDLDGDGSLEAVILGDVYDCSVGDPDGDLYVMPWIFNKDRTRWSGSGFDWTVLPTPGPGSGPLSQDYDIIENNVHNTVLADLDGDGRKEILFPSYDGKLHALWLDKTEHGSWPFDVPGSGIRFASEPVVADLDNDGQAEVILTSWPEKVDGRLGQLHVLNSMGQQLFALDLPAAGAYVNTAWNGALGAPTISNIDADPDLEVVVGTVHAGVAAYDLPGSAGGRILWGTGRGNLRRTGATGPTPPVSIADAPAVTEGNAGTTNATFTVTLAFAGSGTVSVAYATANGTATAGADYVASSGVLTFLQGITSRTLTVPVSGDLLDEANETFVVNLSSPVGATVGDGQGVGTILDDDLPPGLSITDGSGPEGSCSPSSLTLPVTLSGPSGKTVSVSYVTAGGTATPELDYETSMGTLTLAAGATSAALVVPLIGDLVDEPSETFTVALSAPIDVTILDPMATATIVDDDAPGASSARELTHGSDLLADLGAQPGPVADQDVYGLSEKPRSSYEVIVDALSGDVAPLLVERRSCLGGVVQVAASLSGGSSLALRFENASAATVNTERITVSGACGASCDAADVYRIRLRDTSLGIARFNNSGTQTTVLVLQNPSANPVTGHVWFRSVSGAPLGSQTLALGAHSTLVLNTASVVPSAGGSLLVSHDGPYGALTGKTVAVEPATGFTFDTPLKARER